MFVLTDKNFPLYLVQVRITLCCICELDWEFLWTSHDWLKIFFRQKIRSQHAKCNDHIWAVGTLPVSGKKPGCSLSAVSSSSVPHREKNRACEQGGIQFFHTGWIHELCSHGHSTYLLKCSLHHQAFESARLPQLCWQRGVLMHCSQVGYQSSADWICTCKRANSIKSFPYAVCKHNMWLRVASILP